jgi:hypothetical protein
LDKYIDKFFTWFRSRLRLDDVITKLVVSNTNLEKRIKKLEDDRDEYKTELATLKRLKDDKPKIPNFQYHRVG